MEPWSAKAADRLMKSHREHADRMRPIRFSIKQIQAMSDAEIMSIMSGEAGLRGTLYQDTLHLLSTELTRREVERSRNPHWTVKAGLALSAVAALASVVGVIISVLALLRAPEPSPQAQRPVAASPSLSSDSP